MLDSALDIGPLSWVKGELDLALERASNFIADAAGPKEIREAQACLHQCQGALTIVGLDGVTLFAGTLEQLLAAAAADESLWNEAAQQATRAGIATLRSYLDGLMAGSADQPLALYPAYRRLVVARGLPSPTPAALFFPDLNQRPPRREETVPPLAPKAIAARLKAAQLGFARGRQKWLQSLESGVGNNSDDPAGLRDMRNSVAIVELTRESPADRAFWWVCIACFDGLREEIADPDLRQLLERLFSAIAERIDALIGGDVSVPDALMREVLYQVAIADGAGADSESVRVVRSAYRLGDFIPREAADGDRDKLRQERLQLLARHVATAQEEWDRFCGGMAAALPPFHEACLHMAEAVAPNQVDGPGFADLARLTTVIGNIATLLRKNPLAHNEALAEEIVTALLMLEAAVDDLSRPGSTTAPGFANQVEAIGARLIFVFKGLPAPDSLQIHLDTPQLVTLSRRARDKRLLAQVCREMKDNLEQVEQALDAVFRNPDHPELLESVPLLLKQVEGALVIIEQTEAARVIADIMAGMARLSYPGRNAVRLTERDGAARAVAERLAALSAYIAALALGRSNPALLAKAAGSEGDELFSVNSPTLLLRELQTLPTPAANTPAKALAATQLVTDWELPPPALQDAQKELLAIFLDEAATVLDDLADNLPRLQAEPTDPIALRAVRRGFHTLKGSARMVSLDAFGETAWAVEQRLNDWMAASAPASPALLGLLGEARQLFGAWVESLQQDTSPPNGSDLARRFTALPLNEGNRESGRGIANDGNGLGAKTAARDDEAHVTFEPLPPELESTIDPQLLPLFLEESDEAIAAIAEQLRFWRADPEDGDAPARLRRLLHTLKGSARMVGAFGIGELMHGLETRIAEMILPGAHPTEALIDELEDSFDRAVALIDTLRDGEEEGQEQEVEETPAPAPQTGVGQLRIRSEQVDQLINDAGEIAIARTRIEGELKGFKAAMADLTENVSRLRHQLREIEIQAESQMASRHAHVVERDADFDPLEMDRFTRFQELTRMMAESVNDVATLQHTLLRGLEHTTTALGAQSRLNRDLSQGLLRVRMMPFSAITERLHRVVRQTAKELGKQAKLVLVGEHTEVDRSVLERLVAPLEHLLRNALAHGIESPAERRRKGKPETGTVTLNVVQKGGEVVVDLADDGAGLDLARIRQRGEATGLLASDEVPDEQALTALIFLPGFTTATELSAVAGRGVGMDVVRNEVVALGGRIEVRNEADKGCRFLLTLPLTLALGQALLVRMGEGECSRCVGIPASLVEQAMEVPAEEMDQLRREGSLQWMGRRFDWRYLPRLLGQSEAQPPLRRRYWQVLVRGGDRQVALEVDAVIGNQEMVLKPIGPQLERVTGIVGATVLGDGDIALIVNPVALATRSRPRTASPVQVQPSAPVTPVEPSLPTVLVVDDSLTVRKVTGRLLERAGYRVVTAKDGVEALERIMDAVPDLMLADIEMPRMDGFELVRSLRSDPAFRHLPVVMITSRTADKHRSYAAELGVEHYLGKPYDEAELLALAARYTRPDSCPDSGPDSHSDSGAAEAERNDPC